jgi:hypothetical protein
MAVGYRLDCGRRTLRPLGYSFDPTNVLARDTFIETKEGTFLKHYHILAQCS